MPLRLAPALLVTLARRQSLPLRLAPGLLMTLIQQEWALPLRLAPGLLEAVWLRPSHRWGRHI